ncbi:ATP-dependent Clp protease proteolytic subunit (plastid) [Lotharella oceanica]|uniref:ATP-dependent Clp protease proteolytic subunit n=1 Tax=Lotharella oceanica TaxID=641309 RepID=A0A059SLV5_9EUKA|nr:ATP-dependent Clp protease proteolytic subunit [Lotharella oceanica]
MRKIISPIGIPKVPFQDFNDTAPRWIDIYSRLYKERILFLFQMLDEDFINQMIATLLYLDFESQKKPIFFYINSIGGSLMSGITLYDIMQYIKSDIITLCMGMASSISSLILANGKYGKRMILPHSRIILHQPMNEYYGQASDLVIESESMSRLRRLLGKIYIEHTTQTLSRISRDIDRDCFLSSREAKNYGIVDEILSS